MPAGLRRQTAGRRPEVLAENDGFLDEISPADLRHAIASRTHDLARAPWKLDDEALIPEAGRPTTASFPKTSRGR